MVDDAFIAGFTGGGEAGEQGAVVFDGNIGAELLVVLTDGADAVGAGAENLGGFFEGGDVLFGKRLEEQIVAHAAGGITGTALLFQDAESDLVVAENLDERRHNLAALGVVAAHAAHPKGVLLGAVEEGEFEFLDEFVALRGGEAHGVAVTFEVEEEFAAVVVFPGAGVDDAAAEADDYRQMFDADRALVFAGAAGGALKEILHGDVFAEQGFIALDSELIDVGTL